ncbi:unnamed protein product [Caenorhabditis angaria]|uniref:Uncharacterized protein n=1 Tax=Caenorhabditis angaria TaxID=860376 RepID=A0A9P1N561_9PELO|nr:unnamed protein product [Caenorhabditis angaria]
MSRKLILFLFLFGFVQSNSLLSRYFQEQDGDPIQPADPLEDSRVSDADVGMKSERFIGTFGNRPIETRQENTFIDQDGVPVPMLPYESDVSKLNHKLSLRDRFMYRSRSLGPN